MLNVDSIEITLHAKRQYSLRAYKDLFYYLNHPVVDEIKEKIASAFKSMHNPYEFFNICGRRNFELYENGQLIYAIRDNALVTVLNKPGTDIVSDFIRKTKRKYNFF